MFSLVAESDLSEQFDKKLAELLAKLDGSWKTLNERSVQPIQRDGDALETAINIHHQFEEDLQVSLSAPFSLCVSLSLCLGGTSKTPSCRPSIRT